MVLTKAVRRKSPGHRPTAELNYGGYEMPWDNITLQKWHYVMAIAGSMFAILGTLLVSSSSLDAYVPATHGYVKALVKQAEDKLALSDIRMERRQISTQVQVLKGRRGQIEAQISERQLLLQQPGPPQYQKMVQDQIVTFQDDLKGVQDQIDSLEQEMRRTVKPISQ